MGKRILKLFLLIIFSGAIGVIGFFLYKANELTKSVTEFTGPVTKSKTEKNQADSDSKEGPPFKNAKIQADKMFNVVLLGIDRRSKAETAYRTDIMILMSVNQEKKKVVFSSVPRDLWVNGGRINALYTQYGSDTLLDAMHKILGFKPDAYVTCGFEDLVWLVDAAGGVEVDLDTAFTDVEYPNDITKTYITVSFPAGKQKVSGKDALVLSRSRHGNNGEGSDFKRMIRQHKILKGLPEALVNPKNMLNPFTVKRFYEMVTQRMATDLALEDAENIFLLMKDRQSYSIDSFIVDSKYLYNPPLSEYGGAWVLIAKNNDYSAVHTDLKIKLGLLVPPQEPTPQIPATTTQNTKTETADKKAN